MTRIDGEFRPWAPIPGPVDRVSFFEEQVRHRRSTWRLSALCLLAILAMGLVVSVIVSPLVIAQLAIVSGILGSFVAPLGLFADAAQGYFEVVSLMLDGLDGTQQVAPPRMLLGWVVLLAPGMAAMLLVWLWLRSLFLRAGVGGVLLSLGARDPRPDDLEEQQLVNVVAEMAIAAGLRPPRVVLLDSEVPNAAVVGSSPDDATVIVSRRLLDEFDRDQTQAALGHLIGSTGNGDLRIAFTIVSVFQTFGLLTTLLDLPFSARARAALPRVVRFALRSPIRHDAAAEAELITTLLSQALKPEGMDDLLRFMDMDNRPPGLWGRMIVILRGARTFFFLPLILGNVLGRLILSLFVLFLVGPLIAFVWRSRRYLADATAVQLTRNPDGLAAALVELNEKGDLPPGSKWAAHLFVVGTEVTHGRAQQAFMQDIMKLRQRGAGKPALAQALGNVGEVMAAQRRYHQVTQEADSGTFADEHSIVVNFHPPLEARLERLRAQGATVGLRAYT